MMEGRWGPRDLMERRWRSPGPDGGEMGSPGLDGGGDGGPRRLMGAEMGSPECSAGVWRWGFSGRGGLCRWWSPECSGGVRRSPACVGGAGTSQPKHY